MVKQESPVVPTTNGGGQLHRSSWKAEAIRRGDLKISGPIPITEDIPLNDEEEKEYAAKHNIETALERLETPAEQQLGYKRSLNAGSQHTASDRVEMQHPEVQDSPHQLRHKRSSTAIRAISDMQRSTSPDLSASYNSPSPFPSLPDSTAKMTPRKKRRSGLRNVFRRMFGRKGKEDVQEDSFQKHGYHRSDPGVLTHTIEKPVENASTAPRISDLQVRDLQLLNPLGSHLPFPMNVNAPEPASPPQEYLTFDPPPTIRRRRATLPSVILSPAEAQALSATWGSSGTKVTTWDEQRPKQPESIPSPEIGVALSSPKMSPTRKKHNRKSRSAGALRDLWSRQETPSRRRSAEIRYWRSSGADRSVSVYSSHTPRPQTAETEKILQETPREIAEEVREPSFPVSTEPIDQNEQNVSPIPVEAFNFGNLKSEFLADPEEEDAPPFIEQGLPLEERVKVLEDRTQGLESSMHRLTSRSNRQTIILESAPKGRRSDRSSTTTRDGNGSRQSSKSSNKTLSTKQEPSRPPSPTLAPTFLSSPSTAGDGKDKIKPFPGSSETHSPNNQTSNILEPSAMSKPTPSAQSQSPEPGEQITAVYTILRHERSARKALEKQVISLQRELSDLRSLMQKFVNTSPYPTPSPDAIIHPSAEERLSTPRANRRPLARGLGFESEEDIGASCKRRVPERERVVSKFSVDTEGGNEKEEEGGGVSGSSKEDVTSPDVWATPREEGYGFFGRDAEDEMF